MLEREGIDIGVVQGIVGIGWWTSPGAPAGMIFVPSVGGISHSPREYTQPHDVVNGANVLLNAVLRLDGSRG